jgi:hypothetical protein
MPSTYTGSGIELIADGEQSGTWGQTTNTNLEIVSRITSEAGAIALSGTTHTLTISDGILSDGQYGVLVFGGSPSGTNTVTISPNDAKRIFIVRNSSGQSVVLTQGSGGNVTIPASAFKIVYTDGGGAGAEVVDVTSVAAFDTGNITTVNATTVNATTVDSTNVEVTNIKAKDGTASATIADSTGVMTVASSVLTTTDINGGTIDGTVIGGSTPAAISGTTGSFSGDVSIADKIVHTGDTNTAIRFPAADTVTVETAGSERMRITSTGIVGIGTTAEAGNSRLHVTDGVTAFNDGAGSPYFQLYNGNAGTDLKTWRIGGLTAGDFTVETVNDAYTLATSRMAITSAGNVGIGTSSPAQKLVTYAASGNLEILNTVRNDNGGAGIAAIGFNVSAGGEGDFTQAGIGFVRGIANGGGALAFYNKSDGATGNFTTANERMRVDSGGNFIIGGTSSSARFAVLSAQGGNFGNRQIYIEDTTAITSQPGIGFHASANSSAGIIKFYGPSNQFEIRNSTDTGFIAILASAFVVSSDYRLKENIVPLVGACDRLKQIPVHRFNFKPLEETGVEFHDMNGRWLSRA